MKELTQLLELSDDEVAQHAHQVRRRLDECLWSLGLALMAVEGKGLHLAHGCSSLVQYAVRFMDLEAQKASELRRVMRALLFLPLLAEAFRTGEVGWGKMREITRVAKPETEALWLETAREQSTEEIQKRVTMSPRAFRKLEPVDRARNAVPNARSPVVVEAPASAQESLFSPTSETEAPPSPPAEVNALKTPLIKVSFYLTPEQLAHYERAEDRVRQQRGRRVSRNEVLMQLVDGCLAGVSPAAAARLPVVIRVDGHSGKGWFDTRRGLQPATPGQVERAVKEAKTLVAIGPNGSVEPMERKHIPRATMRALYARSGGRCECSGCNSGGPLHVHHLVPVSEGGDNSLANLRLYCTACHALWHREDYALKPTWSKARERRQKAARSSGKRKAGRPRARQPQGTDDVQGGAQMAI